MGQANDLERAQILDAIFDLSREEIVKRVAAGASSDDGFLGKINASYDFTKNAMGYVTLLLALMFYIYGVAGVHLFGGHNAQHFGSLSAALVSLFRMITLDNWSDIFNAARAGAPISAALYFVSFILLGTMIMLNLFIGIIMNSMSEMHAEIEARDRARHVKQFGHATMADDFNLLEEQLDALKVQAAKLKRRLAHESERTQEGSVS